MGDRLAKNWIVVLLGTFASVATILYFMTGQNFPELSKRWRVKHAQSKQLAAPINTTATATWESAVLNAITNRLSELPHEGVVLDTVSVDGGGKVTIKCYARDRGALSRFGKAVAADPVFIYTDLSPLTARPGGDLYDLDLTAFVDHAKLPAVPQRSAE
jgi:hypothetical protein